jgi:hypothetical protein
LQRKRLAKQLGSTDEITQKQARDEAKQFLATINKQACCPQNAVTLAAFIDSVTSRALNNGLARPHYGATR